MLKLNMSYCKYIVRDPKVMLGKPTIAGTRITVELLMRKLANGYTIEKLLESYLNISMDQILGVFEYAADAIANEEIIPIG